MAKSSQYGLSKLIFLITVHHPIRTEYKGEKNEEERHGVVLTIGLFIGLLTADGEIVAYGIRIALALGCGRIKLVDFLTLHSIDLHRVCTNSVKVKASNIGGCVKLILLSVRRNGLNAVNICGNIDLGILATYVVGMSENIRAGIFKKI